jgi:hypothetical protein
VKARFSFPFGKRAVGNYYNFLGIFAGACLGIFIIYTPQLHVVFGGTQHLSPLYWLIPFAFGILLLIWACIRVLLMRASINNQKVKDIKGLMMCEYSLFVFGGTDYLFTMVHSPDHEDDEYAKSGERIDNDICDGQWDWFFLHV